MQEPVFHLADSKTLFSDYHLEEQFVILKIYLH